MIQDTVHTTVTRDEIRQAVQLIPETIRSGSDAGNAILVRMGLAALSHIRRAFIIKARGGTDEAGDSWPPLKHGRIRRGRTKAESKRASRPSQALNARQQARWWEVYRRQLARFQGNKGHAAAVAWRVLKSEGAKTLKDKYGNQQAEILRDTGLLLNSLSPGTGGAPATPEQVFRVSSGAVIIGTNRKGAMAHHHGVPGKLPQRRLWPEPSKWPSSWWQDIVEQVVQGVVDMLIRGVA